MRSNNVEWIYQWFYRPVWQQLVLQQLLIMVLLLGFYFWVWQQNRHDIYAFRINIKEQQHNVAHAQQQLVERPPLVEIQQQIQHMTTSLAQNSDLSLPHKNTPPQNTTVLKRLHLPLIRSGSQLMEWKSLKENEQMLWHIMLSLNYEQLLHFLNEVQKLQPPLLIKRITVTPDNGHLTVRLVFSDFSLPEMTLSETAISNTAFPAPVHEEE